MSAGPAAWARRRRAARIATAGGPRRAVLAGVLPASTWGREWLVTLGRPRALAIRVAVPLVLAVPLVAGGAPTFWAGMLLTVLVAMVGAVGSAMTLARARSSGVLARLAVAPGRPERRVAAWVLASAAIDGLQLLPAVVVAAAGGGLDPAWCGALAAIVPATLLTANALGCAMAALAEGPGEVLLDVAVVLAPLLFLGGIFTGVPRDGWRSVAAALDPFSYLHAAFIGVLGGSPAHGPGAVVAAAAAWSALALLALVPGGRALLARR